jgi:hypothetical protein
MSIGLSRGLQGVENNAANGNAEFTVAIFKARRGLTIIGLGLQSTLNYVELHKGLAKNAKTNIQLSSSNRQNHDTIQSDEFQETLPFRACNAEQLPLSARTFACCYPFGCGHACPRLRHHSGLGQQHHKRSQRRRD